MRCVEDLRQSLDRDDKDEDTEMAAKRKEAKQALAAGSSPPTATCTSARAFSTAFIARIPHEYRRLTQLLLKLL